MNLKKATIKQMVLIIGILTPVIIAFLIGTKSYFNSKEIKLAGESCLENEGIVVVEKTFLNLDYSFSCESH